MARHQGFNYPHLMICACGKTWASTRDEARRLRREVVEFKGSNNPVRFYECASGGWHWTQQVDRPATH